MSKQGKPVAPATNPGPYTGPTITPDQVTFSDDDECYFMQQVGNAPQVKGGGRELVCPGMDDTTFAEVATTNDTSPARFNPQPEPAVKTACDAYNSWAKATAAWQHEQDHHHHD